MTFDKWMEQMSMEVSCQGEENAGIFKKSFEMYEDEAEDDESMGFQV